ncbi:MAG TPA: ParB/RepB/Spo0J family partition protein [Candidatus Acidoferrum sp.]|nr:ParB/RepB/Spo0J family partition protein [Candidatus Acidoferrum sp.]
MTPPPPQQQPPVAPAATLAAPGAAAAAKPALSEGLISVDIDLIDPSPYQPRTRFREEALDELARSIRSSGIVQPLVVRRIGSRFQLIAGERRWRAAQRASLQRVPAVVRDVPEEMALEMTLVENLQREDLNPIEEARAFQKLGDEFHLTQEQMAERTGKDRATIANSLRLLRLDDPIQELIAEGRVTPGHARPLLGIINSDERLALAKKIARGGMTVRQVERFVARGPHPRTAPAVEQTDPNAKSALEELQRVYGTRVLLQAPAPGKPGHLSFEYYNDSDLARLYDELMAD